MPNNWNYNQTSHVNINFRASGTGPAATKDTNIYQNVCDFTADYQRKVNNMWETLEYGGMGDKFLNDRGTYTNVPSNYSKEQIEQFASNQIDNYFTENNVATITKAEKDKLNNMEILVQQQVNETVKEEMKNLPTTGNGTTTTVNNCKCERRFRPKCYAAMYNIYNKDWHFKYLDFAAEYFDGIFLCVEILPAQLGSGSPWNVDETKKTDWDSYRTVPSLTFIKEIKAYCKEKKLDIVGIKFHNDYINNNFLNTSTMSQSGWIDRYETLVNSVMELFPSTEGCKYVTMLNESPLFNGETCKFSSSQINSFNSFLASLNNKGYKTSLCGLSVTPANKGFSTNMVTAHEYTSVGFKGKYTNVQDVINAWDSSLFARKFRRTLNAYKQDNPSIPIGLTETGMVSYWEKFEDPENYDVDNLTQDTSGLPAAIYMAGTLEHFKNSETFDYIMFWYMSDDKSRCCYSSYIKEVLKYYLK